MTNKTAIIKVPAEELALMTEWLERDIQVPDAGRCEVLKTYTAFFGDDIEADIKVCNGDTGPWVDAVLFENGCEIGLLEPDDTLEGEYVFTIDGDNYTVLVEKTT